MANLPMPEGLKTSDLECVMLDVRPIEWEEGYFPKLAELFGEGYNPNDLFYGDTDELKYAQGAVYDSVPHVTLLFGIHPSLTYEEDVESVLHDWFTPDLMSQYVGFFEGDDYYCIVAHLIPTAYLMNARRRLEALPHTTTYPEFKPHMTLAYIKKTANLQLWLERMNKTFANRVFYVAGLNLGKDE